MRKSRFGIATFCIWAMPIAAMSQNLTNETGGSARFYGQISPAFLSFNDGDETDSRIVDNSHSNTRVGFDLEQVLSGGQVVRFKFETALGLPGSSDFSQDDDPVWEWEDTDLRFIDLALESRFGTLSLGQGSMGSDGIAGSDLSGTTLVSAVATSDTAGNYLFRLDDGTLSDIRLSDVYSDFDGGRKGRIRYETPVHKGLSVAIAYGKDVLGDANDNRYLDIGGFYAREHGNVRMAAALGFARVDADGETETETWAGSFSVLHRPSGLNGTIASGGNLDGGRYTYGKIGWIADIWSVGETALSADLYTGLDFVSDTALSRQWGLQAAQKFDDLNLEAYLGYAVYMYEDDNAVYEDANSVMAGLRWKY